VCVRVCFWTELELGLPSTRLLQVKNPWARKRWTGRFSPTDVATWTPALQRALSYQPQSDASDDGIFWIDWPSVVRYA
jgi:calpain-7